jgi:hypothetical protein
MRSLRLALSRRRREKARLRVAAVRADIRDRGLDEDRALALGGALERAGEFLEALEALSEANRRRPDATVERRLVRLRRLAFGELERPLPRPPAPPEDVGAIDLPASPNVTAAELTPARLRTDIGRRGCLWVRGLVPTSHVTRLRDAIDRAFEAREALGAGRATAATSAWYDPVERVPKDGSRTWVREGQGLLAADSPRAFFEFVETLRTLGLDRLVAAYLGERPALSVETCVLRRADRSLHASAWHQDGAFLGVDIRSLDAWFALSPCGRDAPGLEVVPVRLERLLPTGEPGTYFTWTVSPETISRELPHVTVWRPEFEAGDVLFFDHLLLHRTAAEPQMPGVRYAIESWFFAPSMYPHASTPLVV